MSLPSRWLIAATTTAAVGSQPRQAPLFRARARASEVAKEKRERKTRPLDDPIVVVEQDESDEDVFEPPRGFICQAQAGEETRTSSCGLAHYITRNANFIRIDVRFSIVLKVFTATWRYSPPLRSGHPPWVVRSCQTQNTSPCLGNGTARTVRRHVSTVSTVVEGHGVCGEFEPGVSPPVHGKSVLRRCQGSCGCSGSWCILSEYAQSHHQCP